MYEAVIIKQAQSDFHESNARKSTGFKPNSKQRIWNSNAKEWPCWRMYSPTPIKGQDSAWKYASRARVIPTWTCPLSNVNHLQREIFYRREGHDTNLESFTYMECLA
ncbi:uncharacterized protein LOC135154471 [Lytechinus pictus]|uniref:uncharacterized protein LOC135154471 n=1 Tax=Lytechinus pictus TaxID=7653 RepID=UPI0030B9BE11